MIVQNTNLNVEIIRTGIAEENLIETITIMRINLLLGFLFICLAFNACDSNRVYDEYKSVPNQWNKDSIITFNVKPPDSTNAYNLFVNLRNTNDYKYSNLFLIVELNFQTEKLLKIP